MEFDGVDINKLSIEAYVKSNKEINSLFVNLKTISYNKNRSNISAGKLYDFLKNFRKFEKLEKIKIKIKILPERCSWYEWYDLIKEICESEQIKDLSVKINFLILQKKNKYSSVEFVKNNEIYYNGNLLCRYVLNNLPNNIDKLELYIYSRTICLDNENRDETDEHDCVKSCNYLNKVSLDKSVLSNLPMSMKELIINVKTAEHFNNLPVFDISFDDLKLPFNIGITINFQPYDINSDIFNYEKYFDKILKINNIVIISEITSINFNFLGKIELSNNSKKFIKDNNLNYSIGTTKESLTEFLFSTIKINI